LKQRIFYKQLPNSFDTIQVPPPLSIDTIKDSNLRRYLSTRCEKIIEKTKADMMAVYITAAEYEMYESQYKCDTATDLLKKRQRDGYADQYLPDRMHDLLNERLKMIPQRVKYLYNMKVHFFAKAPAATTKKM
jgi:hypothetical protein